MATLYCFLNGEVQQELVKCWQTRVSGQHASRPFNHSLTFHSVVAHSVPHVSHFAGGSSSRDAGGDLRRSSSSGLSVNSCRRDAAPAPELLELTPVARS